MGNGLNQTVFNGVLPAEHHISKRNPPNLFPVIFGRVEFGTVGRQKHQTHVWRSSQAQSIIMKMWCWTECWATSARTSAISLGIDLKQVHAIQKAIARTNDPKQTGLSAQELRGASLRSPVASHLIDPLKVPLARAIVFLFLCGRLGG